MQQNQTIDMTNLSDRTQALISALEGAMMASMQAAAERVQLAAEVARVQQRMQAFVSVLDAVSVQKLALIERREEAKGPRKAALDRQIELLTVQEEAILVKMGCGEETAKKAITVVDHQPKTYKREGRRFAPAIANGTNGHTS